MLFKLGLIIAGILRIFLELCKSTNEQTLRQTGWKAGRQEGRKAGRQEGRKAGRQEGRKVGRQGGLVCRLGRHGHANRHSEYAILDIKVRKCPSQNDYSQHFECCNNEWHYTYCQYAQ
jgi:hypothetical protein